MEKKAPQVLVLFSACNNHHRDFDESVSSFSQMHCNESFFSTISWYDWKFMRNIGKILLLWTNKGNHYAKSEDMLIKPYISIIYLQLFFRARTWEIFFCIFSYVFKIKCFLGSYIGMKVANITVKIHYSRNKLLIFFAIFVTCTFIQLVLTT